FLKDKLRIQDNNSNNLVSPSSEPNRNTLNQASTVIFKYRSRIHNFLFGKQDEAKEDPNSKHAAVREMLGEVRFFCYKMRHATETEQLKPYGKSLPQKLEEKIVGSGPQYHKPTVDTLTEDLADLSVKPNDKDEILNQCHGFNKDGYRCKRKVDLNRFIQKGGALMCHGHGVDEDDEVIVRIEGKGDVLLQWMDLS
ncbi:hypothetical protein BGZ46_006130, partial [Entomortierella lignicola]